MSLSALLSRSCTIYRRSGSGSVDELGDETDTVTTAATTCEVQQRNRDETSEGDWSQAEWIGFFPADTVMDAGDAVEVSGLGLFEVVGAPWNADTGSSAVHHVEATLNKTGGSEDVS